jgi:hypothetical protein
MIWNVPIREMAYSRNMHRPIVASTGGLFSFLLGPKITTHLGTIYYYNVMSMFLGFICTTGPGFDKGCCHKYEILPATYNLSADDFSGFP